MSINTMDHPVRDPDLESVDLQSLDLEDVIPPKWALMALDPSGKRQFLVRRLASGIESDAMVFRSELDSGGHGKLSVAKWNKQPHGEIKMARPDREVRFARMLAESAQADRFAKLLASQDLINGYRESWWQYYELGDMEDLFARTIRFMETPPPLSLAFRIVAQCLEGIQCLNELDVRHMDLHAGNIFFHLAEGASYPDVAIGDFGYSRLKGERPPAFTTAQLAKMDSDDKKAYLTPPLDPDETFGTAGRSWRQRWDLHMFQEKISKILWERYGRKKVRNQLLVSFFKRMSNMCDQDGYDRRLPEAERPPIQDLTPLIEDAKTLARLYAETAADRHALGEIRGKMLDLVRSRSSEPHSFGNEEEARAGYEKHIDAGMLRVVNVSDENSIEVATAELAAYKIKGSAFVSDHSSKSSSSDTNSTSPPTSRGTSPEGDSVQRGAKQDNAGGRATSTSPSTRWTPATRGQASATAFAGGDASAVEALLEARDVAERSQALVRNEHARRRSPGGLGHLFRR